MKQNKQLVSLPYREGRWQDGMLLRMDVTGYAANIIPNKCGVSSCRYKAKSFGVCGVHKKWAYKCDDPAFLEDIKVYKDLVDNYYEECAKLEREGSSLMLIQSLYDYNLCGPVKHKVPENYKDVVHYLQTSVLEIGKLKLKYNESLVCNACTRISHERNTRCICKVCELGK